VSMVLYLRSGCDPWMYCAIQFAGFMPIAHLVPHWDREWVEYAIGRWMLRGGWRAEASTLRDGVDRTRRAHRPGRVVWMKVLRNPVLVTIIQRIGIRIVRCGALRLRFSWTSSGYGVPTALDVEVGTRSMLRLFWWPRVV